MLAGQVSPGGWVSQHALQVSPRGVWSGPGGLVRGVGKGA